MLTYIGDEPSDRLNSPLKSILHGFCCPDKENVSQVTHFARIHCDKSRPLRVRGE